MLAAVFVCLKTSITLWHSGSVNNLNLPCFLIVGSIDLISCLIAFFGTATFLFRFHGASVRLSAKCDDTMFFAAFKACAKMK